MYCHKDEIEWLPGNSLREWRKAFRSVSGPKNVKPAKRGTGNCKQWLPQLPDTEEVAVINHPKLRAES